MAPVASALEKKTKSKGPYICALCAKEFAERLHPEGTRPSTPEPKPAGSLVL